MKWLGAAAFAAGFVLLSKAVKRSDGDLSGKDNAVLNNSVLGFAGIALGVVGALLVVFG